MNKARIHQTDQNKDRWRSQNGKSGPDPVEIVQINAGSVAIAFELVDQIIQWRKKIFSHVLQHLLIII